MFCYAIYWDVIRISRRKKCFDRNVYYFSTKIFDWNHSGNHNLFFFTCTACYETNLGGCSIYGHTIRSVSIYTALRCFNQNSRIVSTNLSCVDDSDHGIGYAIPDEKLEQFFVDNKELGLYRRVIEEITRKKVHTLSAEQEAILADSGELLVAPENIFSMFNNADIRFPEITGEDGTKVPVTHGRYVSYMESKDRRVRKEAFESVYSTYKSMKNTSAAMFSANVKADMFIAKAKKYDSTLAMRLDDSNDTVVGVITIFIMMAHAMWAIWVLTVKTPTARLYYNRLSIFLWCIWLIPYFFEVYLGLSLHSS